MGVDKVGGTLLPFRAFEFATSLRVLGAAIDTPVWTEASPSNFLTRASSASVSAPAALSASVRRMHQSYRAWNFSSVGASSHPKICASGMDTGSLLELVGTA